MVKIKICGITNKEDAQRACRLGAWAVGFIFYRKSPRYVAPDTARKIIMSLPGSVMPVGVFVNEPLKSIRAIVAQCGLKAIQLHGDETPAFCSKLKKILTAKAIRIKGKQDIAKALRYKTDFLLLDTYQKNLLGGTGKTFDWGLAQDPRLSKRKIILSGGLDPENISRALALKNIYAFDVASGVEKRPGKKCVRLLKKFFRQAKNQIRSPKY